jgi:HD-GYP domain-containing protein (c-di-GMP phosphodiesterase class II)
MAKRHLTDTAAVRTRLQSTAQLATLDDVDEVLANLARMLKRAVKSRWAVVYLMDREEQNFAPARCCGLPPEWEPLFRTIPLEPAKQPLLRRMLAQRRHLIIADPAHSDLLSPFFRRILRSLTLLAVPMQVRQQVLGVVFIARSARLSPFSRAEVATVREIVAQAALVASHIRLFDESLDMAVEMAKRIDIILMLDDINKAISSSLSRDQIVATAIGRIGGVVQCDLLAVLTEQQGELVVLASQSETIPLPSEMANGEQAKGKGLSRMAFSSGESRYLPRLSEVKYLVPFDRALARVGVESLLAIPLVTHQGTRGVLLLGDRTPGRFRREEAFSIEKIASQLAVALENARLYDDMRQLFIGTVSSLANAIDAKSPWTKGHSERVMRVAAGIAQDLGLPPARVERVRLAGLLHDIGKIGILEALLEKPVELDEDEFPPIRLHPEKGVAILAPIEQLKDVLPGILYHHEHFDGSGYPQGLAGEEIPLEARIVAVADAFDAMVADRPYREGLKVPEALDELQRCAGTQFDPEVVACFRTKIKRLFRNNQPRHQATPPSQQSPQE